MLRTAPSALEGPRLAANFLPVERRACVRRNCATARRVRSLPRDPPYFFAAGTGGNATDFSTYSLRDWTFTFGRVTRTSIFRRRCVGSGLFE